MLTHRIRLTAAIVPPSSRRCGVLVQYSESWRNVDLSMTVRTVRTRTSSILSRKVLFISSRAGSVIVRRMPETSRIISERQTQGT